MPLSSLCSLQVRLVHAGLGELRVREAEFTFYPGMAGNSTQHPDEKARQYSRMNAAVRDACFASPVAYKAPLETLSAVMKEQGIGRVDLLKVKQAGIMRVWYDPSAQRSCLILHYASGCLFEFLFSLLWIYRHSGRC